MADTEEHHVQLKIMVDKVKNHVLFAEADAYFVDTLLSFLTFPLGTIVRLIGKAQSQPITVGCFKNLYESVKSLDTEHFYTETCQDMLLKPRRLFKEKQNLKINIDDSGPTMYFGCPNNKDLTYKGYCCCFSLYNTSRCFWCRSLMSKKIVFKNLNSSLAATKDMAFVNKASKFIITDDLQVISPGKVIELLNNLSIQDMNVIEERSVTLGSKEFLELLKWMFLSSTPLTDLFVSKRNFPLEDFKRPEKMRCSLNQAEGAVEMKVKVMLRKSNKKVVFAEAECDFINFLFTFLAVPLGQMLHLLDGQSCLQSIDSLYKSTQALDSKYFLSESHKNMLLQPKLPPHFKYCKNQLLPLETAVVDSADGDEIKMEFHEDVEHFVQGPGEFMVMDNLVITPYSPASAISILNTNKISPCDLEERTISLGMAEGLSILRASLNSTSALTYGLFHKLCSKEPKTEIQ